MTRYMGWIKENLNNEKVRDIILAGKYDERFNYALKVTTGIEVFLYEAQFSLHEYKK